MPRFFDDFLNYIVGSRQKNGPNDIRKVYQNMVLLITIVTVIIVCCFYFYFKSEKLFELLTVLSVIGAFYIGGAAIGFIFAIPKSAQGKKIPVISSTSKNNETDKSPAETYNDNTNLEEISDWLTKIIVGISLTQFNTLLTKTDQTAHRIADSLKACSEGCAASDFYVFAYAIIMFYFISGLIIGYMWTRIDFAKILQQNKQDLGKIIQGLKLENSALEQQTSTFVSLINQPNSSVNFTEIEQEEEYNDPQLLKLVTNITNERPIEDKTDLQKGRWGGLPGKSGYLLSVSVSSSKIPYLYKVRICVENTAGLFTSPVAILLHDSFNPVIRLLDANEKQRVFLEVVAYEAFTVAALINVESEKAFLALELDMNETPKLPTGFYWTDK